MKVSVIIPVYNASNYIGQCIESVLRQTYKNFELILINDGSKDDSLDIIYKYAKKDKRICIVHQKNMGVAKTRNKGIKIANGDYITFVDNDDSIDEDYLEKFVSNSNDCDIIIGGYKRVDMHKKVLMRLVLKNTDWSKYTFITPWGRFFKRDFLIKNKIQFFSYPIGEDVFFNLKAYSLTKKIKIIPYVGYNWLYNDNSISNTIHKGFNEKVDIVTFLNKIYDIREIGSKQYIDYYCYKFGIWYLLYSGKSAEKHQFINQYKIIKEWNRKKSIKMNIFPFSFKLSGEKFINRSIVFFFFVLEKLNLISLFAHFYCKK